MKKSISILYPDYDNVSYKKMTETTCHDLALDQLCKSLSEKEIERTMIMKVIETTTSDRQKRRR